MIKIGISGKANSGKDTLSNLIEDEINDLYHTMHLTKIIAFADPIKKIIECMYPQINKEHLFGSSKFRNEIIPGSFKNGLPLTIRVLLQDIGESFKKYNPKIWVNAFDNSFTKCKNKNYNIVIASDLRFIDEYSYLKDNGFYIIRLVRDDVNMMSHISETQQDQIKDNDFNIIINNNGTIDDLRVQVINLIPSLKSE